MGQIITEDGRCEKEIRRRIIIARERFSKMRSVLTNLRINIETRKRIMKCYVWSALLCSAETWTLTPILTRQLEALEIWSHRRMLRNPWTAKVTNERVFNRVNETRQIMKMIRKSKLGYLLVIWSDAETYTEDCKRDI